MAASSSPGQKRDPEYRGLIATATQRKGNNEKNALDHSLDSSGPVPTRTGPLLSRLWSRAFFSLFPFLCVAVAISPLYSGSRFWPGEELAAILDSHPSWRTDVFDKLFYGA